MPEPVSTYAPRTAAATVAAHEHIGHDYHLLSLETATALPLASPGQFVMLQLCRAPWQWDPLLPRPFSILDWAPAGPGVRVRILFRAVGRGTALMGALALGNTVQLTGPWGRPFTPAPRGSQLVLAAGGYGVAPMLWLTKAALAAGHSAADIHFFYGARSHEHILVLDEIRATGVAWHVVTEDGSMGTAGRVTGPLAGFLNARRGPAAVRACGPNAMLEAVWRTSSPFTADCEVSAEAPMACGYGACLGCAMKDQAGKFRIVCREGPVFAGRDLFGDAIA